MLTIYKVKQKGFFPFIIRLFYTLRYFKKCEYNHVMIKNDSLFFEIDYGIKGVNIFNDYNLRKDVIIKECKTYKEDINKNNINDFLVYSNVANFRYVLTTIPILEYFIKKYWKPSKKYINCCGYIAIITGNEKYFNYHPNDFK